VTTVLQDLRYAVRGLAKSPGWTVAAVLTLALGVGANVAVFSLVDTLMLRPISGLADPGRLVWVAPTEEGRPRAASYPDFAEFREQAAVFSGVAAFDRVPVHASSAQQAERLQAEIASGEYFDVLGVVPAVGRFFTADDERERRPVAVLSSAYWRTRFGGDPRAIGATLSLNGRHWTVVGVAPASFAGLDIEALPDLYLPLGTWLEASGHGEELQSRASARLRVIARLKPGVGRNAAAAAVAAVARRTTSLRRTSARQPSATVEGLKGWVPPGQLGQMLPIALLGMAATGTVLLIASANVANLLLGRAARRRREIGVRLAIGASRGRIVRQLLSESLVLAGLGAAAGVLVASSTLDLLLSRFSVPAGLVPAVDARVLLYAIAAALATGVVFGLAPAWSAVRPAAISALRDASGSPSGPQGSKLQAGLVVAQVALSLLLLACAGLFLRSLGKAASVPVGFDRARASEILTVSFDLETQGYPPEKARRFRSDLLARVAALPGARAAALAETLPLGHRAVAEVLGPEGREPAERHEGTVFLDAVSPGFFATLGMPLVAGRDFTAEDRPGSLPVVIVNETLARRFWPGRNPLGRRIVTGGEPHEAFEVVGVARDGKYLRLTEPARPFAYFPILQRGSHLAETTLLVRGAPGVAMAQQVRAAARALDPALPLFQPRSLEDALRESTTDRRQGTLLLAAFGTLALALAAVGLYGVIAYAVTQRRREIGVRLALGASRRDVVALFVSRGFRLAAYGVAIGLPLAAAVTHLLSRLLYGVTPMDLTTLVGASSLLMAIAILASGLPARRAARIDPMEALRNE
jgi:predicted permease